MTDGEPEPTWEKRRTAGSYSPGFEPSLHTSQLRHDYSQMWMKSCEQATPWWANCSVETYEGQHHSPLIAWEPRKPLLLFQGSCQKPKTCHLLFCSASWPFSFTFHCFHFPDSPRWEIMKTLSEKPLCSHSWTAPEWYRQTCLSSRTAKKWSLQFWKSKRKFWCCGKFIRMTVTKCKTWANHKSP